MAVIPDLFDDEPQVQTKQSLVIPDLFDDEQTTQEPQKPKNKDFFEALGAEITPEMEQQAPFLSAIGKTAQDFVTVPMNFLNSALMNLPKSALNQMGVDMPQTENKAAKVGSNVAGVAGIFSNPALKALGVGKAGAGIKKAAAQGAALGALESPTDDIADVKQRAKQAAAGALTGGAFQAAGKVIGALPNITEKGAAKLVNQLIKPSKAQFAYGKNPGLQIAKEKIKATDFDDLLIKVRQRRERVGKSISNLLDAKKNSSKIADYSSALKSIDLAIKRVSSFGRDNTAALNRLRNLRLDMVGAVDDASGNLMITRDLTKLTPKQAFNLKKAIGDQTKFTGNPSDDEIVNSALKGSYRAIKNKLDQSVPGLRKQNERYANLISAELAVKNRELLARKEKLVNKVSAGLVGAGIGAGVTGGSLPGAAGGAIAVNALIDTFQTNPKYAIALSRGILNLSIAGRRVLLEQNPGVREALIQYYKGGTTQLGGKVLRVLNED